MTSSQETRQDSNRVLVDEEEENNEDVDMDMLEEVQIQDEALQSGTQVTQIRSQNQSKQRKRKGKEKGNEPEKRKGEPKSTHWKEFTIEWVEEGDPPRKTRKGKCIRCGTLIAADSHAHGTNGLKNHTTACLRKNANAGGQTILNYTASGTGSGSLTSWRFDQKAVRLSLCEMIILDELPFIFVEREGFRRFVDRICPQFQIPSRQTIRTDCVKLFLERKDVIKSFYQKKGMGRVSITTDCWTSVNNTNFICVTAHCINRDWILHKKIITFCPIVSHKGTDIGEAIVTSFKEWGLTKVLCCTTNNATSNDGAIRHVRAYLDTIKTNVMDGNYIHMRCAAHVLNLVVKDGLEEIGMSVRRVREAVKWVKASPARYTQFFNCVTVLQDKITCRKGLSLDVPTRWNSTYLMLESAEPYEEVWKMCGTMFATYTADLLQKKHENFPIGPPEAADWVNVRKIIEYLKKFYELTLLVSGTTYATSHLFLLEMCDIFDLISDLEHNDDYEISSMAIKMRFKIGKYWLEEEAMNPMMNRILYIAAALDPRQKMKHVEKCLKSVYGAERGATLTREVTYAMNEMFEFYMGLYKVNLPPPRVPSTSTVTPSQGRRDRRGALTCLALDSDEEPDESDKNELTLYLTEKQHKLAKDEVDKFDILQWWLKNSPRYPVLSEMARDILAIPTSSVASESAFSTGGRVLSPYRSSLASSMVEALICAEDWLKTSSINKKDEEGVPYEELERGFEMVLINMRDEEARTTQTAQSESGGIAS